MKLAHDEKHYVKKQTGEGESVFSIRTCMYG